MSEKQTNNTWRRDGLGLVLFAVFAFLGVLVIMAWAQPPSDAAGGRSGFVMGLIGFLGELPLLLGCLGLVWLGFRLFLGEVPEKLGPLGITLVALVLGLSIVLGATWQGHGGSMGRAAAGLLSPVLAALFGMVVIGFPLWRLWIGPALALNSPMEADPIRVLDTDTRDGLSVAEAEALLPEEIQEPTPVPSPYPPDVRREGLIPQGASPIIPDDGRTTTQDPFDAVPVPGTPQGEPQAEQPADPHLVAGGSPAPVESVESGTPEPLRGQAAGEPTVESAPVASPQPLESETRAAGPAAPAEAPESAVVPSPSWEQPELFVEEPVDAYGTPDSLVETLRETEATAEIPTAEVKPAPATEVVEEQVEVAAEQDDPQEPEEEEAEEEEYAEEDEYEEEGEEEGEEVEEDEDAEEDEDTEEEDDAEDEEEYEEEEHEDAEYTEEDDEGEEEEDEGEEEEEDDEEEVEAEETEPQPLAAVEPEVEIVPQRAPQAPAESAPRAEEAPAAPQSESEDDLVFKAGTLILERERVAVSLLQREFHLDFDQATHVLDRLQESGLIGPYVGGQRRDILLSAEEWQEKRVGSS